MTPAQRLAERIISEIHFDRDETKEYLEIFERCLVSLLETALREAIEKNAIVTSDEGTSYCQFCNQQAYSIAEARAEQREIDAKICESQAKIHREFGETTWAALAESYAEQIRSSKPDGKEKV